MKNIRSNPLPAIVKKKDVRTLVEQTLYQRYRDAPLELWVFTLVVLERIAIHLCPYSIEDQDLLEAAIDAAERWAVHQDEEAREFLCSIDPEAKTNEIFHRYYNKRPIPITLEEDFNYSLWAVIELIVSNVCVDNIRYARPLDAALRHLRDNLKRGRNAANSPLSLYSDARKFIVFIVTKILTGKKFPREMFIGLDPESTTNLAYELALRSRK